MKAKCAMLVVIISVSPMATAGIVPASEREALFRRALQEGFWGRAKTPDGKIITPLSSDDRQTMPVNKNVANLAFDVGEVSGIAQWCGVDWRRNLEALTRQARKNNQTERQVAFISVVHGVAQGFLASAMESSGTCSAQEQKNVEEKVGLFLEAEPK